MMKKIQIRFFGPVILAGLLVTGCGTMATRNWDPAEHSVPRESLTLSSGDQIRVQFFGATELNTEQAIRRDGMITLQLIGDVSVRGLTPEEAEAFLTEQYKGQLQVQEISVVVVSLAPVYVSGAVLSPGPVMSPRSLTALEAIMEAGGFSPVANEDKVVVIRYEDDQRKAYQLDFGDALKGKPTPPFYLEPSDIIHVPEVMF